MGQVSFLAPGLAQTEMGGGGQDHIYPEVSPRPVQVTILALSLQADSGAPESGTSTDKFMGYNIASEEASCSPSWWARLWALVE